MTNFIPCKIYNEKIMQYHFVGFGKTAVCNFETKLAYVENTTGSERTQELNCSYLTKDLFIEETRKAYLDYINLTLSN